MQVNNKTEAAAITLAVAVLKLIADWGDRSEMINREYINELYITFFQFELCDKLYKEFPEVEEQTIDILVEQAVTTGVRDISIIREWIISEVGE